MTEKIIFETEVKTGNSAKSIGSVKAELRSLKNEMARLGSGKEFDALAIRAGELQDTIEDVNNTVKAFNPEARFTAFASVLGGVANGFSALQGTMALFGTENKEIEKVILKTQAAMALATGVNGLMGMKDQFKNLVGVVGEAIPFIQRFSAATLAAVSGGVAFIALGISFVFEKIREKTEAAAKEQERYNKALSELEEKIDWRDIYKQQLDEKKRAFEDLRDQHEKELQELQKFIEDNGIAQEVGDKKRRDLLQKQYLEEKDFVAKQKKEEEERAEEERRRIAQKEKERKAKQEQERREEQERLDKRINQIIVLEEFKRKTLKEQEEADLAALKSTADMQRAIFEQEQKQIAAQIDLDHKQREERLNNISMIGNALANLSSIADQHTIGNKALGIASATIDTYVGFNKALAGSPPPFNFFAAAGVLAAGIASVRRIMAVDVPKSPLAKNAPGSVGGSAPAPIIPPSSNLTRLTGSNNPILTRELNVKNQKVFVVSHDITDAQRRDALIKKKATIE